MPKCDSSEYGESSADHHQKLGPNHVFNYDDLRRSLEACEIYITIQIRNEAGHLGTRNYRNGPSARGLDYYVKLLSDDLCNVKTWIEHLYYPKQEGKIAAKPLQTVIRYCKSSNDKFRDAPFRLLSKLERLL